MGIVHIFCLFLIRIVSDGSGLLISGIMLGEIPHNSAIFGIECMNQSFGDAQGNHRNSLVIVDIPTAVFVLVIEHDVFDSICLEACNG